RAKGHVRDRRADSDRADERVPRLPELLQRADQPIASRQRGHVVAERRLHALRRSARYRPALTERRVQRRHALAASIAAGRGPLGNGNLAPRLPCLIEAEAIRIALFHLAAGARELGGELLDPLARIARDGDAAEVRAPG